MTPVISRSSSPISLVPGATFTTRKNSSLRRCCFLRNSAKRTSYAQDFILPLPASVRLFPNIRTCDLHHKPLMKMVSATEVDVAVEQPDSSVADQDSSVADQDSSVADQDSPVTVEAASNVQTNVDSSKSKRARPGRKSEMPPVKNEDLVSGATFTGKVRSIQPFGAFVDFGAFSDGLVHVSQLSDNFVKDVGAVVSVGQEVQVRILEANAETGRISLTMRTIDGTGTADRGIADRGTADRDRKGPPRRNTQNSNQKRDGPGKKTTSKFVKGQELEGTVKDFARSGCFISLPDGEDGFLPQSEEANEGIGSVMGQTSLEIGQKVSVRVLRISRGQATLTMRKEETSLSSDLEIDIGNVYVASTPFLHAFRKNKEISAYLDEREKVKERIESLKSVESAVLTVEEESVMNSDILSPEESVSFVDQVTETAIESLGSVESPGLTAEEESVVTSDILSPEESVSSVNQVTETTIESSEVVEVKSDGQYDEPIVLNAVEESVVTSDILAPEESVSSVDQVTETTIETSEVVKVKSDGQSDELVPDEGKIETPISEAAISSPPPVELEKAAADSDESIHITSEVLSEVPGDESEISSPTPIEDAKIEPNSVEDGSITSERQIQTPGADENSIISSSQETASEETPVTEVVEKQIDDVLPKDEVLIETPKLDVAQEEDKSLVPTSELDVGIIGSNGQASVPSPKETTVKATISPALVKQLREETGAGMMDCKRALTETEGDIIKAQEYLRKKGLASADKKASRATAEGRIGSYIHDSRIGVLIEVNCETDFVSRGDIFKELVDDLAMQVAACPQVKYLATEDVPQTLIDKEREIEMQKEDLASKPEQIRSKIVDGRINKRLEELALLEQPYIKNDKVVVKDFVKQTIATVGENMKVNRFVRFNLGEGLEKKSQDFAAEVAAQTTAKSAPAPVIDQPSAVEVKETDDKPPKVTISAALVKQLREETGAGMMDCKKALSETGGDLEKAQEFLRKKGLSTADKKSSRIAAEGRIGSYIHDSRIGVLIEVNCETDFVGRSEKFKALVDDLAMQVAAYPKVEYVSVEEIPESIVKKEKELEMQREDILSKPESIREKIVDGRVSKRLGELSLLEQPFIKDDSVLVKDLVKQSIAAIGENIKVRRFVRFTLGEAAVAKTEAEV